jgi:hypothetical protein
MLIPALAGCLMMQGCGFAPDGAPRRVEPLDATIAAPCAHPGDFLTGSNSEVIIGRMGDAMILCGKKHLAAVGYSAALTETINGPR